MELRKLKKIKRGPAILLQKDIGVVLGNASIDKESRVLDAGSGCGVLTCNLARFVKRVYSYDNRKEFLDIAKENAKNLLEKDSAKITFKSGTSFFSSGRLSEFKYTILSPSSPFCMLAPCSSVNSTNEIYLI